LPGEDGEGNDEDDEVDVFLLLILRYEPSDRRGESEEDVESAEDSSEGNEVDSDMLPSDDNDSIDNESVELEICGSISE